MLRAKGRACPGYVGWLAQCARACSSSFHVFQALIHVTAALPCNRCSPAEFLPQAAEEFEEALSRCDSMLSALSFASAGSAAFGMGGLPYGPAALSRGRLASLSAMGMARLGSVTGAGAGPGGRLADIEEDEDTDEGPQQQQQGRVGLR